MCNTKTLNEILSITENRLKDIFKGSLMNVILYGSYARGDYDNESDIDVVALVYMDRVELKKYFKDVVELSLEIDLKYGVMLSPSVLSYKEYEKYKSDYLAKIPMKQVVTSLNVSVAAGVFLFEVGRQRSISPS